MTRSLLQARYMQGTPNDHMGQATATNVVPSARSLLLCWEAAEEPGS